jgi:peroxin-2
LFLLPLISGRSLRRHLMRFIASFDIKSFVRSFLANKQSAATTSEVNTTLKRGRYWSFPVDQCAICAENASFDLLLKAPTNPFSTPLNASSDDVPSFSHEKPREAVAAVDDELPTYPIYTPYRASCGDLYCYHCLADRMMRAGEEKEAWVCIRCGEVVRGAGRLIMEDGELSGSGSELSDADITDLEMSGSMTSHSE